MINLRAFSMASVSALSLSAAPGLAQVATEAPGEVSGTSAAAWGSEGHDEIIVTANKRAQVLTDVGLSVAVLDSSALQTRNVTNVEDLANVVPGLTVGQSGYSTPIYSLRGVGSNEATIGAGSSVSVYVDEVPLTLPVMTRGATLDLERVEVLKGPQGTLYGQNATGGTINYIAAKPTNTFQAGVNASYGRFNNAQIEGYVSGPLSDTLKGRIAARVERQFDGWQKSFSRPDDRLGKTKKFAGRAILQWDPSDDFRITLNGNGWIDKSDTQAAQLVQVVGATGNGSGPILPQVANAPAILAPLNPANIPTRIRTGILPSNARAADWDANPMFGPFRSDDWFWQGSVRADYDLSDEVTLTSISAYMKSRVDANRENDGIGSSLATYPQSASNPARTVNIGDDIRDGGYLVNARTRSFSQELRLAAQFGIVNWVLGANYLDERTGEYNFVDLEDLGVIRFLPNPPGVGPGYGQSSFTNYQRIKAFGVFTNVEFELSDMFTVSGGLRISQEKRRFHGCTRAVGAQAPVTNAQTNITRAGRGLPPLSGEDIIMEGDCTTLDPDFVPREARGVLKESNVPWNINVNFKPMERSLIYARVSKGFKSGNFPSFSAAANSSYSPVKQEELLAYEIGFKTQPARWFSAEGAIFQYNYTDKQQRGREDTGFPFRLVARQVNIPKSRIKGAEGTITLRPIEGLTVAASGTYLQSKILKYEGFNVDGRCISTVQGGGICNTLAPALPAINAKGRALNFTPKYSANVDINYTFPINDTTSAFVGGNMSYRSKQESQLVAMEVWDIKPYTLFDAQAGINLRDGDLRLWVWGKNLGNKYYWTNQIKQADMVARYAGMPRTYGISAALKFR